MAKKKKTLATVVPKSSRSFAQKFIACPRCEAPAARPCRTPAGNLVRSGMHQERHDIVLELITYYRKTGTRFATHRMAKMIEEMEEESR